jgi:hypothetical protein
MIVHNPEDYNLIGFQRSTQPNKKYDALLLNKKTKRIRLIRFGQKGFEQYFDKIGLYSQFNHNDKKRRQLYINRHKNDINNVYSSGWFSFHYLW